MTFEKIMSIVTKHWPKWDDETKELVSTLLAYTENLRMEEN